MFYLTALLLAVLPHAIAQSYAKEQVLGVYLFHRHGDRTSKSTPPANLTTLGYDQVYRSGEYYRSRYIESDAALRISGIETDVAKQSQIAISAPEDDVLQHSAMGFVQGLYPPVGDRMATVTLGNGSEVTAPLNGYQLVSVTDVDQGTDSENNAWLQSATGCNQAAVSSNQYFSSKEYNDLLGSTKDFYRSLSPVVEGTFNLSRLSYENAYTIFDLINVARIDNTSFPNSDQVTDEVFSRLASLANTHEWSLAYNDSQSKMENVRGISAMVLAGEIVEFLNKTITSKGKQKIGVQFGAYATFASFFGLSGLEKVNPGFRNIVDYASSMAFELFTNSSTSVTSGSFPSANEIYVRFLYSNGTASDASEPVVYPLFGLDQDVLTWNDFNTGMSKFAVQSTKQWCETCGNTDGSCASSTPGESSNNGSTSSAPYQGRSGNGLSPAVNGVIGAMTTLAILLGIATLVLLVGGYRIVSKKKLASVTWPVHVDELKGTV